MFRRVFMALLIVCLATPAVALPVHCAPVAPDKAMTMMHHAGHHGEKHHSPAPATAPHDCIGCIAPYASDPADPGPAFHGKPPLGEVRAPFHALAPPAPDTPPPRA